jgi:GAF domain-containing protein
MAVDEAALAESLITLLSRVDLPPATDQQQLLDRLDEVLRAATEVLRVDSVGLMLLDEHDALHVVGTTDDAASALEAAQLELRIGPAIDCLGTGRSVGVADLAASADYARVRDWLTDRPDPPATGVRSVLSAPVLVRGETVGTLNALHRTPQRWDAAQVRAVEAYAGLIGVLLRLGAADPTGRGATFPTGPPGAA